MDRNVQGISETEAAAAATAAAVAAAAELGELQKGARNNRRIRHICGGI